MNFRTTIFFSSLAFIALANTACGGSGPAPAAKTELLPADGGDLGKAFVELTNAFKAADKVHAAKLLDPQAWHLENKQPDWFAQFTEQLSDYTPTGGKRQGDRATLFVVTKQPYYAMMNAAHTAGGWQFDSPIPTGSSINDKGRDCAASGHWFPCTAASAPDAQVSGTVTSHRKADPLTGAAKPVTLLDGVAVRMLDSESKALKSTKLMLSGTGINPQMMALSYEPSEVAQWLNYPLLTLDVAPDGKSAKLEYYDGASHKSFDVRDGFSIDASTPNRIHGHLKTDSKDVAEFDVSFDVGTASECIDGAYRCSTE